MAGDRARGARELVDGLERVAENPRRRAGFRHASLGNARFPEIEAAPGRYVTARSD